MLSSKDILSMHEFEDLDDREYIESVSSKQMRSLKPIRASFKSVTKKKFKNRKENPNKI